MRFCSKYFAHKFCVSGIYLKKNNTQWYTFFHLNVKMVEKYSHKTRQICSPAYIQFFDNIIFSVPIVAHNNTNTKIDMTYSDIQADSNHLLGKLFQSILDIDVLSNTTFNNICFVGKYTSVETCRRRKPLTCSKLTDNLYQIKLHRVYTSS